MSKCNLYTTKPFMTGRSQAVRLPKEFRFKDEELIVNRVGDSVVITPKNSVKSVFYEGLNMVTDDFLVDGRPEEEPNSEVKI